MVNVASAGGALDAWGATPQQDYDAFTVSQDEYGFVVVEVEAGDDPRFERVRVSQGTPDAPLDNGVRDRVTVRRDNRPPEPPAPRTAAGSTVDPTCFTLALGGFGDADGDAHAATRWQIAADCEGLMRRRATSGGNARTGSTAWIRRPMAT